MRLARDRRGGDVIAVAVKGVSRTRPVVVVGEEGVLGDVLGHPARAVGPRGRGGVNAPGVMHTVNVEYSGEENG